MDKLNEQWLHGEPNFYFRFKRELIESLVEGSCINIGCGSHIIPGALNVDEGLPKLPYADASFETVVCSDVLEHIAPYREAIVELQRIARKRVIITVPAYQWLYGDYDKALGHHRRYAIEEFPDFRTRYLFWHLVPVLALRKLLNLRHRPLPAWLDSLFYELGKVRMPFGTTILAVQERQPDGSMPVSTRR
jgi:hypothetical protein